MAKTLDDSGDPRAQHRQRDVLQLVRPGDRRQAHDLARLRGCRSIRSSARSTTGGSRPACGSSARPSRASPPRRTDCTGPMDFAAFFNPEGAPGLARGHQPRRILGGRASGLQRRRTDVQRIGRRGLLHVPPLRHDREREPHRDLSRHRQRQHPADRALRNAPDDAAGLRLGMAGAAAHRHRTHVRGLRRLGGRLLLSRHELRAELGREHVRGAHARPARARDEVGPALVATEPPHHRRGAEAARPG